MRKNISIDSNLANELKEYAERKHGFTHGAIRAEAEKAIKNHIGGGG